MNLLNAVMATRMLTRNFESVVGDSGISFGSVWWFVYAGISCFLVLFAGIMSGLTLGLMSLSLVDLEILQRSGTSIEKKQAAAILPVVQKQHQLLVTLLLCNAVAMEALPIYLDKLFNQYIAIVLSVTFVLAFGEVIPQAICTRYGLAVGANFVWLVRFLMIICYPIAYPIGKVLDWVLGHNEALFRRAQLKALVSIHGKEAGKGGELTHDETTIISGALDLTEKTAEEAMTPIESTFSLDVNSKLDWEAMGKILARGHSRVPVYSGNPKNIIGLLLVKSLLTVRPETETPVSAVSIRRIPRVPADMPLYDILNEFQKGSSHMAAVVKAKGKGKTLPPTLDGEKPEENKGTDENSQLTTPLLSKQDEKSDTVVVVDIDMPPRPINMIRPPSLQRNDAARSGLSHLSEDIEDGEVIGIITLEDVFEELLQEEIVDETDEYVDVHNRIIIADWCCMCKSGGESVNHLLLHCEIAKAIWDEVFKRMDMAWVMPETVLDVLACWNSIRGVRQIKAVWKMIPICIMWCLWQERNERTFEDKERSVEELKLLFFRTLCTWAIAVDLNGMDLHEFLVSYMPT